MAPKPEWERSGAKECFALSRNDRKIILYGQLLTTLTTAHDSESSGRIVWLSEGGSKPAVSAAPCLRRMRLAPAALDQLPNIVIRDAKLHRLWLIDLPVLGRQMTTATRDVFKGILRNASERVLFANALENRRELASLDVDSLWGTVAWFADEPDHIVIFDDAVDPRLLGPACYWSKS